MGTETLVRRDILQAISDTINDTWIPRAYHQAQQVTNQILQEFKQARRAPMISLQQFKQRLASEVMMLGRDPGMLDRSVGYLHGMGAVLRDEMTGVVVLDAMSWLVEVLSLFVGGESNREVPLISSTYTSTFSNSNTNSNSNNSHDYQDRYQYQQQGLARLEDIMPHAKKMGCEGVGEMLEVMRVLEQLDLCFCVEGGPQVAQLLELHRQQQQQNQDRRVVPTVETLSSSSSLQLSSVSYLFPCLLKTVSQDQRDHWWPQPARYVHTLIEDLQYGRDPVGVKVTGRRWQVAEEKRSISMIPPAFFPTLQSRIFKHFTQRSSSSSSSKSASVQMGLHLLVLQSADRQNSALLEYSALDSNLTLVVRGEGPYWLLCELFDLIEDILRHYRGVKLTRSALCPACLKANITLNARPHPLEFDCQNIRHKHHPDHWNYTWRLREGKLEEDEKNLYMKPDIAPAGCWTLLPHHQQQQQQERQEENQPVKEEKILPCPRCNSELFSCVTPCNKNHLLFGSDDHSLPLPLLEEQKSDLKQDASFSSPIFTNDPSSTAPSLLFYSASTSIATVTSSNQTNQNSNNQQQQFLPALNGPCFNSPYDNTQGEEKPLRLEGTRCSVFLCHPITGCDPLIRVLSFLLQLSGIEFFSEEMTSQSSTDPATRNDHRRRCLYDCELSVVVVNEWLFDGSVPGARCVIRELRTLLKRQQQELQQQPRQKVKRPDEEEAKKSSGGGGGGGALKMLVVFVSEEAKEECKNRGGELGEMLLRQPVSICLQSSSSSSLHLDPHQQQSKRRRMIHKWSEESKDRVFEEASQIGWEVLKMLPSSSGSILQYLSPMEEKTRRDQLVSLLKERYPPDFPFHHLHPSSSNLQVRMVNRCGYEIPLLEVGRLQFESKVLAQGSFGEVFKGVYDGKMWVVSKRAKPPSHVSSNEEKEEWKKSVIREAFISHRACSSSYSSSSNSSTSIINTNPPHQPAATPSSSSKGPPDNNNNNSNNDRSKMSSVNVVQFVGVVESMAVDPISGELEMRMELVYEYLGGGSLLKVLADEGRYLSNKRGDVSMVVRMARDGGKGLLELHRRGIVHRDVAIRNLLMDEQQRVCICDFGLARLLPLSPSSSPTGAGITSHQSQHASEVVITRERTFPITGAPESLDEHRSILSCKSDVFMFGCTLWEIFTRTFPFWWLANGDDAGILEERRKMLPRQHENPTAQMLAAHLKDNVKVAVPRQALVLMLRCLLDVPEARPEMEEVARELERMYEELVKGGEANEELKMEVSPVPTLEELLRPIQVRLQPKTAPIINPPTPAPLPMEIKEEYGDLKTFLSRVLQNEQQEKDVLELLIRHQVELVDLPNFSFEMLVNMAGIALGPASRIVAATSNYRQHQNVSIPAPSLPSSTPLPQAQPPSAPQVIPATIQPDITTDFADLRSFLIGCSLDPNKYLPILERNEVTLQDLPLLSEATLIDRMGFSIGPAARIFAATAKYRTG